MMFRPKNQNNFGAKVAKDVYDASRKTFSGYLRGLRKLPDYDEQQAFNGAELGMGRSLAAFISHRHEIDHGYDGVREGVVMGFTLSIGHLWGCDNPDELKEMVKSIFFLTGVPKNRRLAIEILSEIVTDFEAAEERDREGDQWHNDD